LRPNHVVGGNMNKYRTGSVRIDEDRRWRRDLRGMDLFLTDVLTAPLRSRYGYPSGGLDGGPSTGSAQPRADRPSAVEQSHQDRS
jgi:hypothetical protein